MTLKTRDDSVSKNRARSTPARLISQLTAPEPDVNFFSVLMLTLVQVDFNHPELCAVILSYCDIVTRSEINALYFGSHNHSLSNLAGAAQERFSKLMKLVVEAKQVAESKDSKQSENAIQYEAEALLREERELALIRGPVQLSNATYQMTALQMAFFALDQQRYEMIMRYLAPENIKKQIAQHIADCERLGLPRHVDVSDLVDANDAMQRLLRREQDAANKQVIGRVGGAQKKLAMDARHVMQRVFPCEKDFSELGEKFYLCGNVRATCALHDEEYVSVRRYAVLIKKFKGYDDLTRIINYLQLEVIAANKLVKVFGIPAEPASLFTAPLPPYGMTLIDHQSPSVSGDASPSSSWLAKCSLA